MDTPTRLTPKQLKVQAANRRNRQKPGYAEYHREYNRRWAAKNKSKVKATDLLRRFGITLDDYRAMLAAQGSKCAICNEHETENKSLSVDHCHGTGRVRGLLCNNCNRGLGLLRDSPELLDKASTYIRNYQ